MIRVKIGLDGYVYVKRDEATPIGWRCLEDCEYGWARGLDEVVSR